MAVIICAMGLAVGVCGGFDLGGFTVADHIGRNVAEGGNRQKWNEGQHWNDSDVFGQQHAKAGLPSVAFH